MDLGTPDLVLTLPAFDVPATGVVSYQIVTVANPLDKGRLGARGDAGAG